MKAIFSRRVVLVAAVFCLPALFACPTRAQVWEAVPIVTAAARQAGSHGGEGCQWPQALAVDGGEGNFLLFGTDVGGIFRSLDGGRTWRRAGLGGQDWGGWTYGGYAVNDQSYFGGCRRGGGDNDPRTLVLTREGGRTLQDTGLRFRGPGVCGGDPADARVLFASNYRSADGGATWQPMDGCDAVFTADAARPGTFYGGRGDRVVVSRDHGAAWSEVAALPGGHPVRDVACAGRAGRLYAVADGSQQLFTVDLAGGKVTEITDRLVADQMGRRGAWSVAVDPADPRVVYTARPGNTYLSDAAVCRSTDGGQTWASLTRSLRLPGAMPAGPDGGREAMWVRVHPRTRYAYFGTNCFGMWKIGPPAPDAAPR